MKVFLRKEKRDISVNDNNETKVILPFEYEEDEHYYVEKLGEIPAKPVYSFLKRCIDVVGSVFGLIICFIPMLVIAAAIKLTSPGKVFYSQERLGLNGEKFMLIKFRTMRTDAEKSGAQWSKGKADDRITPIGAFLRKTRIDELPQLWLCLTGKLSLVGPRPERGVFYDEFEKHIHGFSERLKVKPGLTGLAQVCGGYDLRPEEKVVYDVEYIKKRSIFLDIKILFMTVGVILNHDGAR
ncbi:MAG: sugar transferase [Ruminococcaceae bacterium]|nr:sugar transferase [Oscillospiraceae bacterium]